MKCLGTTTFSRAVSFREYSSQVMEAWEKLWKKAALSLSEKHSRIFESFQSVKLSEYRHETGKRFQIRFQ